MDSQSEICAEDPDMEGPVTGRDVLVEDMRQLCIHDVTKEYRITLKHAMIGKEPVAYAEKFWKYIERFPDACPVDGNTPSRRFGTECANRLMENVGLNVSEVQTCMADTGMEKLRAERDHPAWSPRALRINGWRYTGVVDADLVTRAICAGFVERPKQCGELLKPRDPFKPFVRTRAKPAVSVTEFAGLIVAMVLVLVGAFMCYKRHLKSDMRRSLKEEVMLEVQCAMGEYGKLSGGMGP